MSIKPEDFVAMLQCPDVQSSLLLMFENFCASSELKLLQRLADLEDRVLELEDQNQVLKEKLQSKVEKIRESAIVTVEPSTVTDIRTDHLIEYIENNEEVPEADSGFVNLKVKYMNSKVFKNFVSTILPEALRPKSFKNLRKLKKDLFENAATRYKDIAMIDKANHGNKELRLLIAKELPSRSVTG